jgi:hypothetical protein
MGIARHGATGMRSRMRYGEEARRVLFDIPLPRDSMMNKSLILLLLVFWIFLAYRALQRGDIAMAALFGIVGVSLTAYRLRGRSGS